MIETFDTPNEDPVTEQANRIEAAVNVMADPESHTEQEIQKAIAFLADVRSTDVWGDGLSPNKEGCYE